MTGRFYIVRWRARPDAGPQFHDVYLMSDRPGQSERDAVEQPDLKVSCNVREAWRFKYRFLPACIAQARSRYSDYHLPADIGMVFVEESVSVSLLSPVSGEGAAA